jgi:hypothetical protein
MNRSSVAVLACLLAASCGGDDSPDRGEPSGSGDTSVTIRGGERIEWDQPTNSPQIAASYTFALYVDGTPASLSDVRCANERSAGGVVCSGRLPPLARGRHSLELTAAASGGESDRSLPLSVNVSSLIASVADAASGADAANASRDLAASTGAIACTDVAPQECYQPRLLASFATEVTSLVGTKDRLFFVEGDTRVRVIEGDTLEAMPALTMDGARIAGLAIPPDFERSHLVFVAWSEPSDNGSEVLHISRYRELQGVLGEGAVIVTGLPLAPGERAALAIDRDAFVYVALPASGGPTGGAASNGAILRFNPDGTVPDVNPYQSPIIAHGYDHPASLVWDDGTRSLWLSGSDSRWSSPVSTLQIEPDARRQWPWLPAQAESLASQSPAHGFPLLAVTTGSDQGRSRYLWLAEGSESLARAALAAGRRSPGRAAAIAFDQLGGVVAITDDRADQLIVVTRRPLSSGIDTWGIWRLSPAQGSRAVLR